MPTFGRPLPAPSGSLATASLVGAPDGDEAGAPRVPRGERLVVKGVSRSFGGVRAVNEVDLVVEPGTVHALVGPNGSGKTTLLNLISGFYRLHGGEVWLGDERLDRKRAADITRAGVARTFQTPKLSLYDTAAGNVLIGADRASRGTLAGTVLHTRRALRAEREAVQRAVDALAEVGLADQAAAFAAELPHGTQRLVEIARVVALEPKLVLLDEPAAGLSVAETEVLKENVRRMARAGLSVLLVEHNLPVVFDVADHVTVLDQGEVLASGTPESVSADPEVIRVYLGRSRPDAKTAQVLVGELHDE
jgi:ABC-type branched-subunit amino acid transport system ATPase component